MLSLLKPTEVAHRLGVSRAWVYDAAKRGRIPSIRIGGEEGPLRFVPEDLELWIDDARAAWTPGRPAVVTRQLPIPPRAGRRGGRPRRPQAPHSGQQQLLSDV
jgi:excisionase family DNA binding protein